MYLVSSVVHEKKFYFVSKLEKILLETGPGQCRQPSLIDAIGYCPTSPPGWPNEIFMDFVANYTLSFLIFWFSEENSYHYQLKNLSIRSWKWDLVKDALKQKNSQCTNRWEEKGIVSKLDLHLIATLFYSSKYLLFCA